MGFVNDIIEATQNMIVLVVSFFIKKDCTRKKIVILFT